MRGVILLSALPAALLLAACSSDGEDAGEGTATATATATATSSDDNAEARQELASARQRWDALGVVAYRFEMRWVCFCPPPTADPVVVTVRDGVVDSVTDLDGALVDYPVKHQTVEALFEWLAAAFSSDADTVSARYDIKTGAPIAGFKDPLRDLYDDEDGFEIRAIEVLETRDD